MIKRNRWDIIADLITNNQYKVIAEIGIDCADMGRRILPICNSIVQYICVDINRRVEAEDVLNNPKTIFLNMASVEASKQIEDNSIDLIFIDADHEYESVRQDIKVWIPKIKKDGIISGHDYSSAHPGVIKAVEETFPLCEFELDWQVTLY